MNNEELRLVLTNKQSWLVFRVFGIIATIIIGVLIHIVSMEIKNTQTQLITLTEEMLNQQGVLSELTKQIVIQNRYLLLTQDSLVNLSSGLNQLTMESSLAYSRGIELSSYSVIREFASSLRSINYVNLAVDDYIIQDWNYVFLLSCITCDKTQDHGFDRQWSIIYGDNTGSVTPTSDIPQFIKDKFVNTQGVTMNVNCGMVHGLADTVRGYLGRNSTHFHSMCQTGPQRKFAIFTSPLFSDEKSSQAIYTGSGVTKIFRK